MYEGKRYIECTECFYRGVLLHCGLEAKLFEVAK